MKHQSLLEERLHYAMEFPKILEDFTKIKFTKKAPTEARSNKEKIKELFSLTYGQPFAILEKGESRAFRPYRVGVVLSGGQAAGGHNVIAGLFDGLKKLHSDSSLIGFLGGPGGIVKGEYKEIYEKELKKFRNTGGFDLIGSGRTKIETEEQLQKSLDLAKKLHLDGLVIIGGDDSNTNAAILAEYFLQHNCNTKVVGVPKTIDGDLKNEHVEVSFGFDTACKTYSEMIGNIARDTLSAKKYYHFIKLMGRSASHIALECALKVHPNYTLIGEEVKENKTTLKEIVHSLVNLIIDRNEKKKNYGLILIPEGLIEFIPEMGQLIRDLNQLLAKEEESFDSSMPEQKLEKALSKLESSSKILMESLPKSIQMQLILDRDPHGNVQVSHIATEKLFLELVKRELQILKKEGKYDGKFNAVEHFFGYEGRSGFPSNFDATYCYSLGLTSSLLIHEGLSGYMASVKRLTKHPSEWQIAAVPITSLFNLEERQGKSKPVIQKALVDLKGKPFQFFSEYRKKWMIEDDYAFPGPIQFFGPLLITNSIPKTLELERES